MVVQAQVVCKVVSVHACVRFRLESAYAHASCILPCMLLCRSVSFSLCIGQLSACWEVMNIYIYIEVPEGTMGKHGNPTSPDVIGFDEKGSYEFVKTNSLVLTRNSRIELVVAHQSTQSSMFWWRARSILVLNVSEIVSSEW